MSSIQSRRVSAKTIIQLVSDPRHLLEEQTAHVRRMLRRKKGIAGVLKGKHQEFAAALIQSENRLVLCDGYIRGQALAEGVVTPDRHYPYYLRLHHVADRSEANVLFEQYNNLSADKKFETALHEAGVFSKVTSNLVLSKGRVTAVQYASGVKLSTRVKEAAHAVMSGIVFVDGLGLVREAHEFGGSIGVYYAIAQFTPKKYAHLVEQFIRAVNQAKAFKPRNASMGALNDYICWLVQNDRQTGGAANMEAFNLGLYAFSAFLYGKTFRNVSLLRRRFGGKMNLQQFQELMQKV